jgi:hypothetical protein
LDGKYDSELDSVVDISMEHDVDEPDGIDLDANPELEMDVDDERGGR